MKWIKGKKCLVLTIVILCIIAIADVWFLRNYYNESVEMAKAIGYNIGYDKGYEEGKNSAQESAYNEGYKEGYDVGQEKGYKVGREAGKAAAAKTQSNIAANASTDQESETVYVSRTGKIHSNPNCSGMKYYTEMTYDEAIASGYDLCKNCY